MSRKMHGLARELVESRTGPASGHQPAEQCAKVCIKIWQPLLQLRQAAQ